jgi:hypothetical protein
VSNQTGNGSDGGGAPMTRYLFIGVGALVGAIVVTFILSLIVAAINNEGLSAGFRILRDFLIIVLALQGIFISIALVVLILQVAALINLLKNEVDPIVDNLRDTAQTARSTAEFVGQNVAQPVIRTLAGITAARVFVGHLLGIRRNTTAGTRIIRAGEDGRK